MCAFLFHFKQNHIDLTFRQWMLLKGKKAKGWRKYTTMYTCFHTSKLNKRFPFPVTSPLSNFKSFIIVWVWYNFKFFSSLCLALLKLHSRVLHWTASQSEVVRFHLTNCTNGWFLCLTALVCISLDFYYPRPGLAKSISFLHKVFCLGTTARLEKSTHFLFR